MKMLRELCSWTMYIAFAFVLAIAVNLFIFQPTHVEGSSMEPTLHNKDMVFINKLPHTFNYEPDYGDIVIIDSRVNRPHTFRDDLMDKLKYNLISSLIFKNTDKSYWIKRVIGRPGDVLEFKDGKVIRNGKVLDEPYIKELMRYQTEDKITVPANHIFVMGDNRNNSSDSRFIGSVPMDHVMGKYIFKIG